MSAARGCGLPQPRPARTAGVSGPVTVVMAKSVCTLFPASALLYTAVTRELLELLFRSETRWRVFLQPSPFQHRLQMYHRNLVFKSLLAHFQLLQSFRVFGQGPNPDHTELPLELPLRVLARLGSPVLSASLGTRLVAPWLLALALPWPSLIGRVSHALRQSSARPCQRLAGLC